MEIRPDYTLITYTIKSTKRFPNNDFLPVLHYKNVLKLGLIFNGWHIRQLFRKNGWYNAWRDGIYDFDHYHSNTHEVMGAFRGKTEVRLGGEDGQKILLEKGDVLIIPAGVAHCNLTPKRKFKCIGAYPHGLEYDMCQGTHERSKALENIKRVPVPEKDPVMGNLGEFRHYW
jgi:uncharacterized protein YjlB